MSETTKYDMSAITAEELGAFEALVLAFKEDQVGLIRVRHEGVERTAIIMVRETEEGVHVAPQALMMDSELFAALTPPAEPDATLIAGERFTGLPEVN